MKALLILAWRDDVGAYVLDCYPENAKDEVDGQDLMNIYNAHRFRSTEKNFQMMKRAGFNAASFYSGGYQSNYVGKPNYCVTLLLENDDNPIEYERVLIKVANNLLTKLDSDDIDYLLMDLYEKLDQKEFDDIKVDRGGFEFEEEEEKLAPKKKLATTSSASLSDEERIFADLLDSTELDSSDKELDSKMADFQKVSPGAADPFAADPFSGGSAADPFGGGGGGGSTAQKSTGFEEDPFAGAQRPDLAKAFGIDEALGKEMFKKTKTSAAEIIKKLESLESSRPQKPADLSDKEKNYAYLKDLVDFLELKVKTLSTLVSSVKDLEQAQEEKDAVIGKLLLMLKGS